MYNRDSLIHAYLAAQGTRYGGYDGEYPGYDAVLKAHHEAMLGGLEELFGVRLRHDGFSTMRERVLFVLFAATARSYLGARTPWSDFLEASLLVKEIEASGSEGERVMAASHEISTLFEQSGEAHRDMLDALATILLGERADLTFTSADLIALGVQVIPPSVDDYLPPAPDFG